MLNVKWEINMLYEFSQVMNIILLPLYARLTHVLKVALNTIKQDITVVSIHMD